jgi:hypothetical protein
MFDGLTIMALWLSYPSGGLQPIGDAALEILASLLFLEVLTIIFKPLKKFRFRKPDPS